MSTDRFKKCYLKRKEDPERYKIFLEKKRLINKKYRLASKAEISKNPDMLALSRANERDRKRRYRESLRKQGENTAEFSSVGYKCPQTLGKALAKVRKSLPKEKEKQEQVIKKLVLEVLPGANISENYKTRADQSLSAETKKIIRNFYYRDYISRPSPCKRGFKSVKLSENEKRVHKPIRYMMSNISEAFQLFQEEYPEVKVKKAVFFKLRPPEVLIASKTPHNVCVCAIHANAEFCLESLRKSGIRTFPKTFRNLLEEICCNVLDENCMFSKCDNCYKIQDIIPLAYNSSSVSWKQWKTIEKRMRLVSYSGTTDELIESLEKDLSKFKKHFFTKAAQSLHFEKLKKNLDEQNVVLQIDFAENYKTIYQNETQAAHFNYNQITIFTACAWTWKSTFSFAIISDSIKHNKTSVWSFLNIIIKSLKDRVPFLRHVHIFSDGAAQQFKNRYTLSNILFAEQDFQMSISWNFFATGHGKGAVDGIGANVKRKVTTLVKANALEVLNAQQFYDCASKNLEGITVYLVPETVIEKNRKNMLERWKNISHIENVQSLHYFRKFSPSELIAATTAMSKEKIIRIV